MTSQLDDEALHPMVSTLLGGGTIPTAPIKSYSREKMMELKTTKASMTRPENLSEDYNGEDGKFIPLKWLEHRWEIEGIKNRPLSKKIDSLCAGADENTGLSPQRRAFSSGCKAPTDDKGRDGEYERLGGHGKNWRNGSNGGADKFAPRGTDFKTSFQKGGQLDRGGARGTEWKKDTTRGPNKFGTRRDERLNSMSGSEKLPEWADGPTTMDDMIELRGFDEPKKARARKNPKETKKEKDGAKPSENECTGSRPSSTGANKEPLDDPAIAYSEMGAGVLPATDQELAVLLGLGGMDISKNARKAGGKDEIYHEETAAASSRLSRFFGKKSKSPELEAMLAASAQAPNDENVANPMLAKLFGANPSQNAASSSHGDIKGGMRLEDLEKGMETKESSKVSPLQDPNQQAQLLAHLHKVAKAQAEAAQIQQQRQPTPPNGVPQNHPHMHHHMPPHPGMIVADPALLLSFSNNPVVLNAYCDNQLQEAISAAVRANNGQQLPSQLHEQLRIASMRNKAFLQSQTLAYVNMLKAQHAMAMQQQQHQQHHQQKGRTPAMIPASVQRQLQKSSSNADQKKEKSGQTPPEATPEGEGDVSVMKKLQMHHQYANMVQAMNSGLGFRGNGVAGAEQQLPPNVQMLMAQAQAQAHAQQHVNHMNQVKMAMARQHQQLMMQKALQYQAQQAMQDRHALNQQHHQQAVPSELSQVGPIQTPLEKLLASVGVQGSQFTVPAGSGERIPQSARPISLEDLEKQFTAAPQN